MNIPDTSIENPPKRKRRVFFLVGGLLLAITLLTGALLWTKGLPFFGDNPQKENVAKVTVPANSEQAVSFKEDENITASQEENSAITDKTVASQEELDADVPSKTDAKKDIYGYLKDFVTQKGVLNGDYCCYSKSADNYGGYSSEDFSLFYWGDTDTVEFCLHSVLDDTFSINFYLSVPKTDTGIYEYISSYYYRDSGNALYEASGTIEADKFNKNYPLKCTKYVGSTDKQSEFMEMSRKGVCDLIDCIKEFIKVENLAYSFADFGFVNF